jgi:xylan 1,4-beta-xylosidase
MVKNDKLYLSGPGDITEPIKAVLGRTTTTGNYVATATIAAKEMKSEAVAGISVFGSSSNAIGASYSNGKVFLWSRTADRTSQLVTTEIQKSDAIYLRVIVSDGFQLRFEYSADNTTWTALTNELSADTLPPWDLGLRVALTASGPTGSQAIFESFQIQPLKEVN